jgi:tetratricopeptide (TPR) repeat protein/TolB-like protein
VYCNFAQWTLLVVGTALCGACAKPEFTHRVAVLRFENLSSTPGQDWIGRAVSEEIAGQLEGTRHHSVVPFAAIQEVDHALGGRPLAAPGVSAERTAAVTAGANRIVTGFYSLRENQLTVTAVEENTETRRQEQIFSGSAPVDDLLHLAEEISRAIDEEARPPVTGSARALRSYALGLESPSAEAVPLFEEAVALDPDFGPPYVALARLALSRHDTAAFAQVFTAMRARGSGVPPVDRAILNLEEARLHAPPAARIDALAALVRLMPADPTWLRELADTALEFNRFPEAADYYGKLEALMPNNPDAVNRLGYALMYSGDEPGAVKAFDQYRRATGDDANAFDSAGDAQFFFGHFAPAANLYASAYEKDPHLIEGGDLIKAAWARLMLNDRAGAERFIGRYRRERAQAHDPLTPYRMAQFERVVGDRGQAERLLAPYLAPNVAPQVRQAATTQLAWWRFLDGAGPAPDSNSPLKPAIVALVQKDNTAALALWRSLANQSPPNDWWIRAVYARLRREPVRFHPIPQPTRAVSFDELWFSATH